MRHSTRRYSTPMRLFRNSAGPMSGRYRSTESTLFENIIDWLSRCSRVFSSISVLMLTFLSAARAVGHMGLARRDASSSTVTRPPAGCIRAIDISVKVI